MKANKTWEALYRQYRELEVRLCTPNDPASSEACDLVRRAVFSSADQIQLAAEAQWRGLAIAADVWKEAAQMRADWSANRERPGRDRDEPPDGRHPDDPLDDVYHAALSALSSPEWEPSPSGERLYRGQRRLSDPRAAPKDRWDVRPTLFRIGVDADAELLKLTAFVRFLQQKIRELDEEGAVALAQHYSKEAGVKTWLLDVTRDPFVAFFFASYGGNEKDIGVINMMPTVEWNQFAAEGRNQFGAIRIVTPPDTLRIHNQRALFIHTSHPSFFEQYVPYAIYFKQHPGLVFEDPTFDPPITSESIYPPTDEVLRLLPFDFSKLDAESLSIGPAGDPGSALTHADYLNLAESWLAEEGVEIDAGQAETLLKLCQVHELLQREPILEMKQRNIHRLKHAVELLADAQRNGQHPDLKRAMWPYTVTGMNDEQRSRFDQILKEVEYGTPTQ
ncbi:MAG TPA: FRG domain-containing protein [Blastocatellia bacterium]|nr:FRG domain-containing protein [Blastocatellia bacterium]